MVNSRGGRVTRSALILITWQSPSLRGCGGVEALDAWLTWAGVAGVMTGAGAFIDFYLGPTGRQRAKDRMVKWWVKIEDVRWAYFGRDEALFALQKMDRLFGRRFFSFRRLIVVAVSTFLVSGFMIVSMAINRIGPFTWPAFVQRSTLLLLVLIVSALAASFSVTRIVSLLVARVLGVARYISLFGLVFLLLFQYLMLCYWSPAMGFKRVYLVDLVVFPPSSYPFFNVMPIWIRIQTFYYMIINLEIKFFYNLAVHGAGRRACYSEAYTRNFHSAEPRSRYRKFHTSSF